MAHPAAPSPTPSPPSPAAIVAHEMMGSLGAIAQWTIVDPAFSKDDLTEHMNLIRAAALHLQTIAADLLDGEVTSLHLGPVRIREILTFARDVHVPLVRGSSLQLEIACAEDVPQMIQSDRTRLSQILINLVSNALKASSTGTVRLSCAVDDGHLRLSVADQGPGLPKDFAIAPFGRATTTQSGHGIGLWLCQNIVQALDGEVRFQTGADGTGAQVDVLLPLASLAYPPTTDPTMLEHPPIRLNQPDREAAAQPIESGAISYRPDVTIRGTSALDQSQKNPLCDMGADQPEAVASASFLAGKFALVVDDSAINRSLMHALLVSFEMEVLCVASRAEAVAAVLRRRPDLILMDEMLVDDRGADVMAKIRGMLGPSCPPAVLVSAWDGLVEGFTARVAKPFSARSLYEAAVEALVPGVDLCESARRSN